MGTQNLRRTETARPTQARAHNRSLVLQHLFQVGPESRADLARSTGLTRVTVSALVDGLLTEGLVQELGSEERTGKVGKRGTLVGLSDDRWCIPAVNLTNDGSISGAILTLSGTIRQHIDEQHPLPKGAEGVDALLSFCRRLISQADSQILGLGISSPGIISEDGVIEQAPNLGWYDVALAEVLSDQLGVAVHIANDANCIALAEYSFGGVEGDELLSIVVGQGMGAGIVSGGTLLLGAGDAAGEIGHVTAMDSRDLGDSPLGTPRLCACGRTGCLETIMSEAALHAAAGDARTEGSEALLGAIGARLGTILAPIVAMLNVSDIVASGPEDLLRGPLLESCEHQIRERTLPRSHRKLRVRLSTLGHDSGLRGAAVLVLSGRLGIA
ncbi:ROK family transcriptional regulator [Ancrocorticia populi]|uniref:Sugar kinase n=1 Tax=Ancrocorticia populi TaxID=2175228 RepID=A0A2V1K4K9_9ACTO|nr:ROK family transcriptional regulator [Ancrocorticia populi]PWF24579.1 sugar kinase [Ancrocorticia populi]